MNCKNCKKEHKIDCKENKLVSIQETPTGSFITVAKCDCNGLEVEMVEVGKIRQQRREIDFNLRLYQCPSCHTIILS